MQASTVTTRLQGRTSGMGHYHYHKSSNRSPQLLFVQSGQTPSL